jgi:hypothetical protein
VCEREVANVLEREKIKQIEGGKDFFKTFVQSLVLLPYGTILALLKT